MLTAALTTAALLTSISNAELQRLDPVTLAPTGAAVRLDGRMYGGWTQRGSRLALAVTERGRVQIVDGRVSRVSRVVRTGRVLAAVLAA